MAVRKVLERVKNMRFNLHDIFVSGEHQWQFLFEHQHTRRHRRHDIPAFINQLNQLRDVFPPQFIDFFEVALFKFGHAAARFFFRQSDRNTIVFKYRDQVFADARFIEVAITGGEQGDPAACWTCFSGLNAPWLVIFAAFFECLCVVIRQVGFGVDIHQL